MIETFDLTKHFDDFVAVQGISLHVDRGEVLALLGPNGAGKTTTVRMLTSVLIPTEGRATVAGYDVVTDAEQVRANVGVLTEGHGLYLRMNGREYLDFFGAMYAVKPERRRQRTQDYAERFGMAEALDRRMSEYSKGMRQKLALIRAIIHDPPVILLDEPTSAMDPHSARQVRDAIHDLRKDGRTIILTTHNLNEAEELADRIAIIRRGEIIARGSVLELKTELLGPPLLELKVADQVDGLVEDLADVVSIDSYGYNWVRFRTPQPQVVNPQLLKQLAAQGVDVITLSEVPQSLEQVYLRAVHDESETRQEDESVSEGQGEA
ncbi:MAG: ABC transporter ATP-binding protein [Chloroflexi bacterium]|nr:ABC transporter ATP-binding protein [Chloroflexota bacterium]